MLHVAPVDRRDRLSREDFVRDYELPGRPVILSGLTDGWPAMEHWCPAYFKQRFGNISVQVEPQQRRARPVTMTMAEFAEHMESNPDRPLYLKSWVIADHCPELRQDFTLPEHFCDDWVRLLPPSIRPELLWIFMGPAGAGTPMHVDIGYTAAWNVQVTGTKRWLFFPPGQEQYLYSGRVDAFHPDLERYRLLRHTTPLEAVVGPGEVMFTPSRWWHQTLSLEPGIAVTGNYANASNYKDVIEFLSQNRKLELLEAFQAVVRDKLRPAAGSQ